MILSYVVVAVILLAGIAIIARLVMTLTGKRGRW